MKQSSSLATVFGAMALVMIASGAATYFMGMLAIHSDEEVAHRRVVIDSLKDTLSTVKDAETGQRGYLLSGNDAYLKPYASAVKRINAELAVLSAEADAGAVRRDEVDAVSTLTRQKLAELQSTIDLHQKQRHDEAVEIVRLNIGNAAMESIRARMDSMVGEQERLLAYERRSADRLTVDRTALFAIVALANLGFLFWAFGRVRREMTGREAAATEVSRQKELLAVTLASIGDAVIVADTSGRITFLNDVAADLTGWPSGEALGQVCSTVFNIINEATRQPVESPVDKVLRLGTIVGLANHTLLIRKDGSMVPIDDSGAPIRETGGAIHGVVLVFRDFSEHKENERTLLAAKTELENASRAKDQFLANLSHELRTPLTPVLATLTTWEASDELPEAFRDDVQMLRRNIALEARLIDDLLDLTRIVRGKLTLEPEVVDTHELLQSVAGMYRSEIQARQIALNLNLNARSNFLKADPGRLQQVFWNILKNAAKFTAPGGRIEIRTIDEPGGQLRITFSDTGIGMTPSLLQRLFQPFEQGSDEIVRRSGGLGLGMAISKAFVEIQGGRISASSEGPGKGSTFTLDFPSVPTPVRAAPTAHDDGPAGRATTRLLNILLVEDHADTARVMGRLLRRLGHTVQISDSVAGALSLARDGAYDILLSDIGLPDGTGLELIRQLKAMKDIPAIALTGFGMDDDIAKCREAGFTAHLTKPVNFQRLEMVIQQLATAKV